MQAALLAQASRKALRTRRSEVKSFSKREADLETELTTVCHSILDVTAAKDQALWEAFGARTTLSDVNKQNQDLRDTLSEKEMAF